MASNDANPDFLISRHHYWRVVGILSLVMTVNPLQAPTSEVNAEEVEVLRNFIETYEALPEPWNPTNTMYLDKINRNIALDKLLNIYVDISVLPYQKWSDHSQQFIKCSFTHTKIASIIL
jgi:hypothetical protein